MRGVIGAALSAALLSAACATSGPLQTVSDLDAQRYLGRWHEVAAIPTWFERDCTGDTTATYEPAGAPGQISVLNACETADGERAIEGRARFTGPPEQGRLEVAFFRPFGSWLWALSGDYQVIALDPDYRWSLVGHPSRDYAWILAREPTLDDSTLVALRNELRRQGYDPCRLVVTGVDRADRGSSLCAV